MSDTIRLILAYICNLSVRIVICIYVFPLIMKTLKKRLYMKVKVSIAAHFINLF